MNPRKPPSEATPAPEPGDEGLLLDWLHGELAREEAEHLEQRLASEPALAQARTAMENLLAAELAAFEDPQSSRRLQADAPRLAAWIRSEARAAEAARTVARAPAATARGRSGWARILAFSVALHVLALGVLALFGGGSKEIQEGQTARFSMSHQSFREHAPDPGEVERMRRYQGVTADGGDDLSDELVLAEQETVGEELPEEEPDAGNSMRPALNHPVGVLVPMTHRRLTVLKKRRLNLLGFNSQGTLRAVERGLRFLSGRQQQDGSFQASGSRSQVQQTGVALLAFLADGHCSTDVRKGRMAEVVQRGTTWLRRTLFPATERLDLKRFSVAELGLAGLVLSEDYMLSYGWLSTAGSQARVSEIAELVSVLRDKLSAREADVSAAATAAAGRPWAVWALDAAGRAGVVVALPTDRTLFRDWMQTASAETATAPENGTLAAFATGTALLFQERGSVKPRFQAWSRTHAEALVRRLDPRGQARTGDAVEDTALILLALQVAYRTY